MKLMKFTIAAALLTLGTAANAAVVVDGTPTGSYRGNWANESTGQNFLIKFTLGTATKINGLDIFTNNPFANVGQAVRIRFRSDDGGAPSATNLFSFDDAIDNNTAFGSGNIIAGTDFTGINFAAGTYWFGVSGLTSELGWSSFDNGGPNPNPNQRQLNGENVTSTPGVHDFAFRIRGEELAGAVPEPTTWMLMLFGFGAIGASLRLRRGPMAAKLA